MLRDLLHLAAFLLSVSLTILNVIAASALNAPLGSEACPGVQTTMQAMLGVRFLVYCGGVVFGGMVLYHTSQGWLRVFVVDAVLLWTAHLAVICFLVDVWTLTVASAWACQLIVRQESETNLVMVAMSLWAMFDMCIAVAGCVTLIGRLKDLVHPEFTSMEMEYRASPT